MGGIGEDDAGATLSLGSGVRVARDALRFAFTSSSGPGGQNVNKRATRAELRVRLDDLPLDAGGVARLASQTGWLITQAGELVITCDEFRSQKMNRDQCIERLGRAVARAMIRPKVRRATKPTKSSQRRRMDDKKRRGEVKRRRGDAGDA